jgi:hypothetical protein
MRIFYPVNSLVVSRNLWLILIRQISLFIIEVEHTLKVFFNSKDSKSVLILSLAVVVVAL